MLENLIKKHKSNDIEEVVYRLSYAKKFIIVKGKTLCGSLIIISGAFNFYSPDNKKMAGHLYRHFYDHVLSNDKGRFTVRVIAKKDRKTDQYKLLKREQMELDKHRYNPKCLNNVVESYIPLFNESTDMFGWLKRSHVMNFKKWLSSKDRQDYIERYAMKPPPKPAMSVL